MNRCSENATSRKALDGADADDVTKAGGAQQGCVTHAAKEGCVGQLSANVGVLDSGLANHDGNDVAGDHHQGHLWRPGKGGGGNREEVGQHSSQ